jgi:hypothetical protein
MDNEEQKWSPNMMCPAETVQAATLSATGQGDAGRTEQPKTTA